MFRLLPILCLLVSALPAAAQHRHDSSAPTEPGQGAFAAIAEIVEILRADPATDWETVDVDALRQHLVDMDLLTTRAEVAVVDLPKGARFELRGDLRTREAVRKWPPTMLHFLRPQPDGT